MKLQPVGFVSAVTTGTEMMHSNSFPIDRGVVQGDIFSLVCFIVALTVILTRHGGCVEGSAVGFLGLFIKSLEYADDAALLDLTIEAATDRINKFAEGAEADANMIVSVPKTECMHIDSELVQHFSRVTVDSSDYDDTGLISKWSHPCMHCNAVFDSRHGLSIHLGR